MEEVDPGSLAFGPGGAAPLCDLGRPICVLLGLTDVDRDGHADLLVRFRTRDTGLSPADDEACLEGSIAGRPFRSCDATAVAPRRGRQIR